MNIKNWLVRGDCHGSFDWIERDLQGYNPEETAIIILGDAGINFYQNHTDKKLKEKINAYKFTFYIVRGNHELRPQHLPDIQWIFDENVNNYIMIEPNYPYIRYFKDYDIYNINNYRCLVIGGAYSVDKWNRLHWAGINDPKDNDPKKTFWFSDECLTPDEMEACERLIANSGDTNFDFVFSHTCPLKYQPRDLFLSFVDQSKVDSSMEVWLDKICEAISFNAWLFGHYHKDRIETAHVEQFYYSVESLDEIYCRWKNYKD